MKINRVKPTMKNQEKHSNAKARGLTMQIAIGRWSKPEIKCSSLIPIRVCLGFVSISIIARDMEVFLCEIMKAHRGITQSLIKEKGQLLDMLKKLVGEEEYQQINYDIFLQAKELLKKIEQK